MSICECISIVSNIRGIQKFNNKWSFQKGVYICVAHSWQMYSSGSCIILFFAFPYKRCYLRRCVKLSARAARSLRDSRGLQGSTRRSNICAWANVVEAHSGKTSVTACINREILCAHRNDYDNISMNTATVKWRTCRTSSVTSHSEKKNVAVTYVNLGLK